MNIKSLRCDYVSGRLLIYGAVWLLAILAFEASLEPEGITETSLSETQQRMHWLLEAPLMAVLGVAQAFSWPAFPGDTAFLSSVICLVLVGILILSCAHRTTFIMLVSCHALILAVAVIFFVRQSHLPSGP